jgi:tetratricopeptide (TPR) repeat protein
MKRLHIIVTALLLSLFAFSLCAQSPQQTLAQPTPQEKQRLTKELQAYRAKKDRHGEAVTLLQLGVAEIGSGNIEGARTNLAEAVEKMRVQNDLIGAWMALLIRSQIEVAAGKSAAAVSLLEQALTALNDAKTSTGPVSFKTLLVFGGVSGLPAEVKKVLDGPDAGPIKPMMIQYSLEPMTHDLYASALTGNGQLEKAETELKAAVAGAALAQGMYDFSIEMHYGDLRYRQQRYDEARTHYVKALKAAPKAGSIISVGGDQQIQVGIYDRLARLETATGHPEEAKRWAKMAREAGTKQPESR